MAAAAEWPEDSLLEATTFSLLMPRHGDTMAPCSPCLPTITSSDPLISSITDLKPPSIAAEYVYVANQLKTTIHSVEKIMTIIKIL